MPTKDKLWSLNIYKEIGSKSRGDKEERKKERNLNKKPSKSKIKKWDYNEVGMNEYLSSTCFKNGGRVYRKSLVNFQIPFLQNKTELAQDYAFSILKYFSMKSQGSCYFHPEIWEIICSKYYLLSSPSTSESSSVY